MKLDSSKAEETVRLQRIVRDWLDKEGSARSTLAGAIVVIDTIRVKAPFERKDVFTGGGQLTGGRGSALVASLSWYGEERRLLADGVTTRSTHKFERLADALSWGKSMEGWEAWEREVAVREIAAPILKEIDDYFAREHMKLRIDQQETPIVWIEALLEAAHGRSQGRVEQHLVGAKLQRRLPEQNITDHAAFAGDVQTARAGDFVIGPVVFHVTAAPAPPVINKCLDNLRHGMRPVLIVPRAMVERAKGLAQYEEGADRRISVLSLEDFVASNIIELASEQDSSFTVVLESILALYNERIEGSETDKSLRIELD